MALPASSLSPTGTTVVSRLAPPARILRTEVGEASEYDSGEMLLEVSLTESTLAPRNRPLTALSECITAPTAVP